jgi:tyrosinase
MPGISRRKFVWGASTIPFALWFEKYASAQTVLTRVNVMSAQGQTRVAQYRTAVAQMMAAPDSSPTGWLFQWYTHSVRTDGGRTKATELARVYPSPSPQRSLANEMWETCQAHHAGDVEDFFLPWHRMYVFFFERIVRKITNDATFTLPYWNYSNTSPSGPRLPPPFISPATAANALFRTNRSAAANGGQPINQSNPTAFSLSALNQCTYSPLGAQPGFNLAIDSGIHGNVHVLVGNTQGMGRVPFAANDPVFWMHHCNIDRLWASWNRAGRTNPTTATWLDKQFVFADECGVRVVGTVRDFRDIAALKYTYDAFETNLACPVVNPLPLAAAALQRHAQTLSGPVKLGPAPVAVRLEPTPGVGAAEADIRPRVRRLKAGRRLFLVLRNLQTDLQPGVLYNVYLELPAAATAQTSNARRVGVIHFFDAEVGHAGHAGAAAGGAPDKFFSFDITALAKTLAASGQLGAKPQVTIAPAGQPESSAQPVVGEITIEEQ